MKMHLVCTASGLKPETDADYDVKKRLRVGETYEVTIHHVRNPKFHRKYFALINCAWEYLGEQWWKFFNNDKDGFRKTVEVAAGYYEPMWSPVRNEWLQVPKSIAFDKMAEDEFSQLYERVKDVLFSVFLGNVNKDEFEEQLVNF